MEAVNNYIELTGRGLFRGTIPVLYLDVLKSKNLWPVSGKTVIEPGYKLQD